MFSMFRIRARASTLMMVVILGAGSGCSTNAKWRHQTSHEVTKTGICGDDPFLLLTNYTKIKRGDSLEKIKALGFDLTKITTNVVQMGYDKGTAEINGFPASSTMHFFDLASHDEYWDAISDRIVYRIPCTDMINRARRIYMNKKDVMVKGFRLDIFIICDREKVIRATHRFELADRTDTFWGLVQGFLGLAKELNGVPHGGVY